MSMFDSIKSFFFGEYTGCASREEFLNIKTFAYYAHAASAVSSIKVNTSSVSVSEFNNDLHKYSTVVELLTVIVYQLFLVKYYLNMEHETDACAMIEADIAEAAGLKHAMCTTEYGLDEKTYASLSKFIDRFESRHDEILEALRHALYGD